MNEFLRVVFSLFITLSIFGCASVPNDMQRAQAVTVVYRSGSLPIEMRLHEGGGTLGLMGALADEATRKKNRDNRTFVEQLHSLNEAQPLLTAFKLQFAEALTSKGMKVQEAASSGGPRLDIRTHVPSFDRSAVKTRWVIQVDEVRTEYSAPNAFAAYKPWIFVKFAIFDMQDPALTPIVPLTPSTTGRNESYHFPDAKAFASATPQYAFSGLQEAVKEAAIDTAQTLKP